MVILIYSDFLPKVLNFDSPRGGISLETQKTRTGTTSKVNIYIIHACTCENGCNLHFMLIVFKNVE